MPNRVALVGCGVMGGAIGTRLREVGETLNSAGLGGAGNAALMKYFDGPESGLE